MKTIKQLLKHELLNTITLINYSLLDAQKHEAELQKLLTKCTLLVKHEEVLLGKKAQFLLQEWSVLEILETITMVWSKVQQQKQAKVSLCKEDMRRYLDRYYLEDALSQIHLALLEEAQQINYDIDPSLSTLIIRHNSKPPLFQNHSIRNALEKKSENSDVGVQLAFKILKQFGCNITEKPGTIAIRIPQKRTKKTGK